MPIPQTGRLADLVQNSPEQHSVILLTLLPDHRHHVTCSSPIPPPQLQSLLRGGLCPQTGSQSEGCLRMLMLGMCHGSEGRENVAVRACDQQIVLPTKDISIPQCSCQSLGVTVWKSNLQSCSPTRRVYPVLPMALRRQASPPVLVQMRIMVRRVRDQARVAGAVAD